jgi:hypothetical protein
MVYSVTSQSKIDDWDFPQKSRTPTDGVDQGSSLGMITTDTSWAKFPLDPKKGLAIVFRVHIPIYGSLYGFITRNSGIYDTYYYSL